ncbi:beta-lactamase family protein [Streptomyces sp. NBC_01275]|uniref:serine hydrolase domain-containing protein n=1 Tax=Streptomyces sp. NBC_01275 TaxID=2903807 RepID=UPI00224FA129|nr:serine hydrolase domain-containing protein [Streptomyces sp. NBC_01275]MCX4767659.1 beta-lactamase family protein [Streptomyces sp. NBC_01275]
MPIRPVRPVPPHRRSPLGARLKTVSLMVVCLSGLLSPTAVAAAPPGPGTDVALQRRLDDLVVTPGGPPGAIAVLRDGDGQRVLAAGVADLITRRAPSPQDHMRIASTAKAFSGAVALSLVDRHALRLDDTLGARLPRLPRAWARVTLRQLLNHTSGLPDYTRDAEFLRIVTADPRHRFDSRRLLDYVADEPLRFRPGSRYLYSNSDNIAVALMAEAVTRTPYEHLLEQLVYRPLDLRHTSLPQGYRMPKPYLHGYDVTPPSPTEDVSEILSASGVWASGGIVSTPDDMTRFVRGYAGGALYGRGVVREQRRWIAGASEPAGPGRNAVGLGIFRYTTRCGVVLGHTGNFPGYTQLIAATPDGRRSLTFSVNSQINQDLAPRLLRQLRSVQEDFVCAVLRGRR